MMNRIAPFVQSHGPGIIVLQRDNVRPYVPRVVQDELQVRNMDSFPWPSISSDRSAIEHVLTS